MNEPLDRDEYVRRLAEESVARYRGVLPDDVVDAMRDFLEDALTTHPVGATLVERARPRVAPERSGDVAKDGAEEADDLQKRGAR